MEVQTTEPVGCHHIKLDSSNRIRLPRNLRERLGINHGDWVVVVEEDNDVRLESIQQTVKRAQEYFASFVPEGVSLVDDLLAERRAEAEHE